MAVVALQVATVLPKVSSYVTLLDLEDGKQRTLHPKGVELWPMAYSPDGKKLALTVGVTGLRGGRHKRSVRVYSVDQRRFIETLQDEGAVTDLVFSPDGRFLAALGKKLRIWRCPG